MTGISSVTVNNMVDDTGDGISGTPYNKTFMQSFINDLIATALPLDGSVAMTGALQELFIGLIRKLNPNGTAHIYEYAGGLLATTTSPTGAGFQQAWTYNVPLASTTIPPTVNNWGGRDITDFCVLVQFLDTGVFEIWFAPSAAAGAAPVWTKVYSFDATTGTLIIASKLFSNNSVPVSPNSHYSMFTATTLPVRWTQGVGASTFGVLNNYAGIVPTIAGNPFIYFTEMSRFALVELTTNPSYSRIRMDFTVLWDTATASDHWVGLFPSNAVAQGILLSPNGTNSLRLRVGNDVSATFDTTVAQAWSINTPYRLSLDFGATDVKVLFNNVQIMTDVTAAHFPSTTALAPAICSRNTAVGLQYVHDNAITLY